MSDATLAASSPAAAGEGCAGARSTPQDSDRDD